MPGPLPEGDAVPASGPLTDDARRALGARPFGLYLHVPFCASRCGYCDFNTYTATELGGGVSRAGYAADLAGELRLARAHLGTVDLPVATVFVGGGTPTLLAAADLVGVLDVVREEFGLRPGAEVTVEANPDSVDAASLATLREGGVTRMSFGMQSAVPHVLSVLERTHTPGRATAAVAAARAAGFEHVSVDLIYGTPGETAPDWARSLAVAVDSGPDHVSAYALVVEEGTRLAARVRRGELPAPDADVLADRYEAADDVLAAAGYDWYEVSNWALPGGECRHNLGYWHGDDWWGAGPGAHSHVAGVRWWNVRHPAAYAALVRAGRLPVAAREVLGDDARQAERVLLGLRLREGLAVAEAPATDEVRARLLADGLVDAAALAAGRWRLTRRGRLLADLVVRALLG